MSYNYMEALKENIREYLSENYEEKALYEKLKDNQAEFEEELHDELWVADSVTGNASGSYTFNSYTAKQYVFENLDLLKEAFDEFGVEASAFFEKGAEYCDVTIRCYLLSSAISETLLDIMVENCITEEDIRNV